MPNQSFNSEAASAGHLPRRSFQIPWPQPSRCFGSAGLLWSLGRNMAHTLQAVLIFICLVGLSGCGRKSKSGSTPQSTQVLPQQDGLRQEPRIVVFGDDQVRIRFQPPPPPYPPEAKVQKIEGVVVLRLHISRAGRVTRVEILSGPEELRSAAETHAKGYEFTADPGAFSPSTGETQFSLSCKFELEREKSHND